MIEKVSSATQITSNAAATGTNAPGPSTGASFKDALRSAKEEAAAPSQNSPETPSLTQFVSDWREAAVQRTKLTESISPEFKPFLETQRIVQRNHLTVQLFGTVTQSTVQSVRTLQQAGGS